jgi:hypothetical protein
MFSAACDGLIMHGIVLLEGLNQSGKKQISSSETGCVNLLGKLYVLKRAFFEKICFKGVENNFIVYIRVKIHSLGPHTKNNLFWKMLRKKC